MSRQGVFMVRGSRVRSPLLEPFSGAGLQHINDSQQASDRRLYAKAVPAALLRRPHGPMVHHG